MLTRWEVEGPLRTLHPMQQHTRRVRRARARARHRVRVTVAVLLAICMVGALAAVRMRPRIASVARLQDSTWGGDHVGSYHVRKGPPLFPPSRRHGLRARVGRPPGARTSTFARD